MRELSQRSQVTLGCCCALLLGGILGLAMWSWWSWRHRPGREPVTRFRRVRAALVAAGLVVIAAGSLWRLAFSFQFMPDCTPGVPAVARGGVFHAWLLAQQATTWPQTGIGLLYSRVSDARICLPRAADYYVAVHANNPPERKC